METLRNTFTVFYTFRSYPTYEEWKLFLAISQSSTHFRSYPTYEELKLANLIPLSKALRVLILPMRNGNIIKSSFKYTFSLFLSYLWGMETLRFSRHIFRLFSCSYPTYEEWKPFFFFAVCKNQSVLILPMRNGNYPSL